MAYLYHISTTQGLGIIEEERVSRRSESEVVGDDRKTRSFKDNRAATNENKEQC